MNQSTTAAQGEASILAGLDVHTDSIDMRRWAKPAGACPLDGGVRLLQPRCRAKHSGTCSRCQPSANAFEQRGIECARRDLLGATKPYNERVGWQRNDQEGCDDEFEATLCDGTAPLCPQERPGNCGDYSGKGGGQWCGTDIQGAG